jgi:hypothetical protein
MPQPSNVKSRNSLAHVRFPVVLALSFIVAWSAGCTLFHPHQMAAPPSPPPAPPAQAPVTRLHRTIHSTPRRSAVRISKPSQPRLIPPPAPVPVVTLDNGYNDKANAQRLLEQATVNLTHINRAELPATTASTYQQANKLIDAAQHAMAAQDYVAASSLAEKASALTSQLPSHK